MKRLLLLTTLSVLMLVTASHAQAPTFVHFDIVSAKLIRNGAGTAVGLRVAVEIVVTGTTETEKAEFKIAGEEFQLMPAGAAAKRAYLVAIAKREVQTRLNHWLAEVAARPQPEQERDVLTDFGVARVSTLANAATPTPTPVP